MDEESSYQQSFMLYSSLNILWIFVSVHAIALLVFLNLSVLFPRTFTPRHAFVVDSAEYIDEVYYYGSGPQEIDENYLHQQWYRAETVAS